MLIACEAGERESKESWLSVLRALKARGLKFPKVTVADGHLGIWAALGEIHPAGDEQRCWNHKIINVLDALGKKDQATASEYLRVMMYAESRSACQKKRDEFVLRFIDAFRQGLRELGYVEGQNIRIDFRWQPIERPDLLPEIVSELVRSKPEVLVGPTTPQALALKQATTTIPIVMVVPSDPVGTGLVASLSQPGGNVTGLAWMSNDIIRKRLELLKETFPKTLRVSDLWNPSNPATRRDFKEVAAAAAMMGMTLHSVEVRDPSELPGAFSSIASARTEALIVQTDQLTYVHRREIASLALQKRLPTMFFAREHVDEGGLMSYGANLADMYRRSAVYVDKILKGAKPSELPVQQPTKFEFVVNLKTAKTLGVTIPGSILFRADDVIR